MKYRIKIEAYKDGSVKYYPQYYKGWFSGWKSIQFDGELCMHTDNISTNNKESALKSIDLCEKGKNIIISIKYEYINKNN